MGSKEIRKAFLDYFEKKGHKIVPSAPMVMKDDPTLMFTNAGMNQFKDYFLGTLKPEAKRVADTQKCLRVTGKHNDLEEVGHDTYHHTMFEMLGNWSFGDYFKEEAIGWAWEFLTEVVKLDSERIYATVFEGDKSDRLTMDVEAADLWKKYLPAERILQGSKKDNFWEMGATGPCGPCSEVHVDLRNSKEREKVPGAQLINRDHPLVVEIWNLVFIQYNRLSDGSLKNLPEKHVDTGMGFERLCMALQSKESSYDTDIFSPVINRIESLTGINYGDNEKTDIAMRVIADHLRAISFSVAEGQLPSNTKAGYVIRRILRRAIRYGYTYLNQSEPFIYRVLPAITEVLGDTFTELITQEDLISKVIREEEQSFLNTLENGIRRLNQMKEMMLDQGLNKLDGRQAFELYDTYGFPVDLTALILREQNLGVDHEGFDREMAKQKQRSKKAAATEKSDWTILQENDYELFTGYDQSTEKVRITRYREVRMKDKKIFHLVFDRTPFYPEGGGQIGDKGLIENDHEKIEIKDTRRENELIIHITNRLPDDPGAVFTARVNESDRTRTASNHTATHLTHFALRKILGKHVEQKGSMVGPEMFRFDFAHFQKLTDEEIREVEKTVNRLIRENIPVDENRQMPINDARRMGAISLFGEKYGEQVRVIKFGDSIELCGGIHAAATGQLGFFKILKESSIAAGIRRIEAVTGVEAEKYIYSQLDKINLIAGQLEKHTDLVDAVRKLVSEHNELSREVARFKQNSVGATLNTLKKNVQKIGSINFIADILNDADADMLRDAAFKLKNESENLFLVLASKQDNKALMVVMISENLIKEKGLNAAEIIKTIAREIRGGGGGQPFFATAGGKDPAGIPEALKKAEELIRNLQ